MPNIMKIMAKPVISSATMHTPTQGKKRANTRAHIARRTGASIGPAAGRRIV